MRVLPKETKAFRAWAVPAKESVNKDLTVPLWVAQKLKDETIVVEEDGTIKLNGDELDSFGYLILCENSGTVLYKTNQEFNDEYSLAS